MSNSFCNGKPATTPSSVQTDIISGYTKDAQKLTEQFESISSEKLFASIADYLPEQGSAIDIGAGTGRDAVWLTSRGFQVVAVEPVKAFREGGISNNPTFAIEWVEDSLPTLSSITERNRQFDLILLIAVWHHIAPSHQYKAMQRIQQISKAGSRLVISLRNGPGSPSRQCFPITSEETIRLAQQCGFQLLKKQTAESVQTRNRNAGVTWTWLVFEAI